jgi:AAA15 family ATPase/GTPase
VLTAIEIENFKAFGERQRIELRPITLLFGPNSGGKSSVSHALHYFREVMCEGNLDASTAHGPAGSPLISAAFRVSCMGGS